MVWMRFYRRRAFILEEGYIRYKSTLTGPRKRCEATEKVCALWQGWGRKKVGGLPLARGRYSFG